MHVRTSARRSVTLALPVLLLALTLLCLAAPAFALSGRVGPQPAAAWKPGDLTARLARGAETWHGIYDAQPTGTMVFSWSASMTVTGTDAAGVPVWSTESGDVWAASGRLPAALVATFPDGDPNVLRDGELRAYNANGSTRFHKRFTRKFVQPLADTSKRLVWVETSARAVTRVYVRQGSTTRSLALPYVPPKASFPMVAAASADASRIIVGVNMPRQDRRAVMTYWLQVRPDGSLRRVSHGVTDWVLAALTPHGDKAAILTSDGLGDGPNWWVRFGAFHGRYLPGNDAGTIYASSDKIFQLGSYGYGSDTTSWGATTVEVFEQQSLMGIYKRTWTWDDADSSIWVRCDGRITRLAAVDDKGTLTAMNVDDWAIATVPGTYADAVPIEGGRVATMTSDGTLAFIADPVPGP